MLSRLLLQFEDDDLQQRFKYSRQEFYRKALPLITFLILGLAIALEVIYHGMHINIGSLSVATSVINWGYFTLFVIMSFIIRRW
jgi:dolichyl-phosphate-mannose--protein O-mannosyl transferase